MDPTTEAGRALLADYPGLAGLEYGRTGEPIVLAIEAEARSAAGAALLHLAQRDHEHSDGCDGCLNVKRQIAAAMQDGAKP